MRRLALSVGMVLLGLQVAVTGAELSRELTDLLTAGRAALEDGMAGVARRQFEQFLSTAPRRTPVETRDDVTLLLVRALHEERDYARMLSVLGVERYQSEGPQDAVRFWRAVALHGLAQPSEAMTALERYEERYPGSPFVGRVHRLRAWCLLQLDRVDDALSEFGRFDGLRRGSPEYPQNLLDFGKALLGAGRVAQAEEVIARLEDEATPVPLRHEGRYWQGRVHEAREEWAAMQRTMQAVATNTLATAGVRRAAWMGAGKAAEALGDFEGALRAHRAALDVATDSAGRREATLRLGRLLLKQKRFDEAVPLLKRMIADNPDSPDAAGAHLTLAHALLADGRHEQAAAEYLQFLEAFDDPQLQADAYAGRGDALMALERYAEAATAYRTAAQRVEDPTRRARYVFHTGDAYLANAQYGKARDEYARVVAEHGSSELAPAAALQRAECLALEGEHEAAAAAFEDVVAAYPKQAVAEEALYRLARLREARDDWEGAITVFNRLMSDYTNGLFYAEALYGRGGAEFRLFRFEEALKDFAQVTAAHPASAVADRAAFKQVLCYFWMGRDDEALEKARQFIEAGSTSRILPEVRFWVGTLHYNRGEYEAAERAYRGLAEQHPEDALADDSLLWAGRAAASRKEFVRALEILSGLVKQYPKSPLMAEVRFAQANVMCDLASYDAAILVFDEIIHKYPKSELVDLAWGRKGDCQFTLATGAPERYRESLDSYRVVANSATAGPDLVLQAEYKIGRCLEKMGRTEDALDQFYTRVVVRYLRAQAEGVWHNESARLWFTRAAFNAADIMESREDWRGVIRVLERVADADVPASEEARERIKTLHAEHWWMLY